MKTWTRKDFLRGSLAGGGALLVAGSAGVTTSAFGAPAVAAPGSASGDIRIAVVGVRSQGAGHARTYYKLPGTRLVALCDPDATILDARAEAAAKEGVTVTKYRDYRKLLENKDIDAVVIATPNHWHSLMTIWALQAGKDVYVEKPLSHNIWEGRQAVEAAGRYKGRIVQSGTQNRSSKDIRSAIEYIRAGNIGKILNARGLCYKERESIGPRTSPQPVPATFDYDHWTGPADLVPSRRNGPRGGAFHYDWHWLWNYGGGDISNQGIHQVDVARWMLGEAGLPRTSMSVGGRYVYPDAAETPNTQICVYNYEKAPLIFEVRGLPTKAGMKAMDAYKGSRVGVIVQCEGGYAQVSEGGNVIIFDNDGKRMQQFNEGGNGNHRQNFVDAVRSRKQDVATGQLLDAHLSITLCHLGNISYLLGADKANAAIAEAVKADASMNEAFGRMQEHLKANLVDVDRTLTVQGPALAFDAASELFVGPTPVLADAANASPLRKREGRAPYRVPQIAAT
jgi:predicted dehydrogenase